MAKTTDTLRLLIIDALAKAPEGMPLSKLVTIINQKRSVERQTIHGTLSQLVKRQEVLRLDDSRCGECNHIVSCYSLSRRMRSELALNGGLK